MMRKLIIVAGLFVLPCVLQAKTLDDLLVEKGVITKAEAGAASAAGPKIYWNGGTRIEFPDQGFSTQINTFMQNRYTYTDADEDAGAKNTSSFDIYKARIIVSGTALNNEFYYKLAPDFIADTDEGGEHTPRLVDAIIGWKPIQDVSIRMGQFKTGISRQYNTEDQSLQMINRSKASDYFSLGREQGARADAAIMDGALNVSAGIFNGESVGEAINQPGVDTKHTGIVNLSWNAMGKMDSKTEGDLDWSDSPALVFGAAYAASRGDTATGDLDQDTISVDASFKGQGWSMNAEYYVRTVSVEGDDDITPQGFYVQLGYFVDPKVLEIAAMYSLLDCDDGKASGMCAGYDKVNHVQAGLNYYLWKHNLKAQLGFEHINQDNGSNDIDTNKWCLQLTAYF